MSDATNVPKDEPKSFVRRDFLRDIESKIQAHWESNKEFEVDVTEADLDKPKFMCTFPYPYMNGRLHLGHAFSLSKAEFAAGFQRQQGKRVLFPFGFHCTGMPIQAAANKLRREIEAGAPATIDEKSDEMVVEENVPEATPAPPTDGAPVEKSLDVFKSKKTKAVAKGASGAKLTQYQILRASNIPEDEIPSFQDPLHWLRYFPPLGQKDLHRFGLRTDWRRSFITTDVNPYYDAFIRWQFNTLRKRDKIGFGKRPTVYSPIDGQACADHDRASGEGVGPQEYTLIKLKVQEIPSTHASYADIKTLVDFVNTQKRSVFLVAATLRPETMYGQTNCYLLPEGEYGLFEMANGDIFVCSERSAKNMAYQDLTAEYGKTVKLASYTGLQLMGLPLSGPYSPFQTVYSLPLLSISMKKGTGVVTSVPSDSPDDFACLRDLTQKPLLREKYNVTDEMVLPFAPVGIIDIPGYGRLAAEAVCDELKIRSQNDKVLLAEAKEKVYQLGFYQGVMAVGKYAGKKVFEAKPLVRADLIAEGLAVPYWEPESLVMSRSGDECVVAVLDQWYLKYGETEWRNVLEKYVKSPLFNAYQPLTQAAFEHTVSWLQEWACSRSFGLGTRLPWDPQFVIESLSDSTIYMAYYTISHKLQGGVVDGSVVGPAGIRPEQLNDSVFDYIFLDGEYDATQMNGIPEATLKELKQEFKYWYPMDLRVSGRDLIGNHLTMSLYTHAAIWGPEIERYIDELDKVSLPSSVDFSVSSSITTAGSISNPEAVKALDLFLKNMPRSMYTNGHVLVDGEKMSKSTGNFIMLYEAMERYTSDCTRFALADAGDTMEDANFERERADQAILKLYTEMDFFTEMRSLANAGQLRGTWQCPNLSVAELDAGSAQNLAYGIDIAELTYADRVMLARINSLIPQATAAYEQMRYRDALRNSFFELLIARDSYRDYCEKLCQPMHAGVLARFARTTVLLMAPITPHWSEHAWLNVLGLGEECSSVTRAQWPSYSQALLLSEQGLLDSYTYLQSKLHDFRVDIIKSQQLKPSQIARGMVPAKKPTHIRIFVDDKYPQWQAEPLAALQKLFDPQQYGDANCGFAPDALLKVREVVTNSPTLKPSMKKIMPLLSLTIQAQKGRQTPTDALLMRLPFDELATWIDNATYVSKALEINDVEVVVLSSVLDRIDELDPSKKVKDIVLPGTPYFYAWAESN